MRSEIVCKYLEFGATPVMKSGEYVRKANDDWGACQCPFCDNYVKNEGETLKIGDKCWKCNAEVIRFDELSKTP